MYAIQVHNIYEMLFNFSHTFSSLVFNNCLYLTNLCLNAYFLHDTSQTFYHSQLPFLCAWAYNYYHYYFLYILRF
jgi:hypothetical protein